MTGNLLITAAISLLHWDEAHFRVEDTGLSAVKRRRVYGSPRRDRHRVARDRRGHVATNVTLHATS